MEKMKIGIIAGAIISLITPLVANASNLSDIDGNKNQTAIEYLFDKAVISGYPDGTFKPTNTVNRAELLKILVGGKGEAPTVQDYNNCFPDVKDEWFAPYVCYAKANNWVSGYPDGTFKPTKEVNKVEALKMLVNSQGYELPSSVTDQLFNDADNSVWYAPFLKVAKDKGLLEQKSGNYGITSNMTRGEISENIYRTMIVNSEKLTNFWEYLNKPVLLNGKGTKATDQFELQKGLAIVKLSHKGKSNFIVEILNSTGETIGYLSNQIGNFEGIATVKVPDNGNYLLNVTADGTWKIEINQSTATLKTENSSTLSGKGTSITGLVELSGLKTFNLTHDGKSNFIVTILDLEGNTVEYLSNEIGSFDGSVAKSITNGTYIFNVQADGNWTIDIK